MQDLFYTHSQSLAEEGSKPGGTNRQRRKYFYIKSYGALLKSGGAATP